MSIFQRKKNIAPLLEGFVDIHCHVLPGLDDGAKNIADTKEMLAAYRQLGYKKIIATPHVLKGSYPNRKETIYPAYDKVCAEAKALNIISNPAAEHMLDEDFETLLKDKGLLPLKDNYVLVEMSYFQKPTNLTEIIFNMEHKGYIPVLAHPERYNFIKDIKEFKDLKKRGCMFQLNMLSLSKHYGPHVQRKANLLLKNDFYDFAATDAHHKRHLDKISEIKISKKRYEKLDSIIKKTSATFV